MRDRSFGRTVLLGVASAGLTAVAAGQAWANASGDAAGVEVTATASGSEAAPLALALALVALASWGAVLVLRGRARRLAAVVGALAAAGVLVSVLVGGDAAEDAAVAAVVAEGATGDAFVASLTAWYWVTAVAAALTLTSLLVAVRKAPAWPAMGTRYDAPATRAAAPATDQDLWRAMDEGHDPTA
ncbi:MAG: Trp biosynthesis-associated membrane protein [Nocardioides sp.]